MNKTVRNCRQRGFIIDVSHQAVEDNNIMNNVLKWIKPIEVKNDIESVAQVV